MPTESAVFPHAPQRWIWLLLGTLALCCSNGATANIVAAWLAPVLLLRSVAVGRPLAAWGFPALAIALSTCVTMRGVIPVAPMEFLVTCLVSGALGALPYLGHRVLAPRLGAVAGSLVFPSASVTLLYLLSASSPFGTWGVDGYVQAGFPLLPQFAAIAGIWGVTFLVLWFASAVQDRIALRAFAIVFVPVLAFGAAWKTTAPAPSARTNVAALTTPAGLPDKFFDGCTTRGDAECRNAGARKRMDALFSRAADAVNGGAALVVWPEAGAQYDAVLEREFVTRARDFAREHRIYLVAGAARVADNRKAPMENKAMVFTPTGDLAFEYHKAIPVPSEPIVAGDGVIRTVDTPFGRLGVVICFDADFPMLVRQARRRGVDVLAIPANDWRAITPMHGQMARFRAIENGFAVVRATSNGLSLIADSTGTVLASVDSHSTPGGIASARLPVVPRSTPYSRVGDAFALACMLLFGALASIVLVKRYTNKR